MDITLQELMEMMDSGPVINTKEYPSDTVLFRNDSTNRLPFISNISCGELILASQEYESYIDVDSNLNADFALKAIGDSMVGARINDGDWVLCKKQGMVNNGEIAIVEIDDEITLKRFNYYKDQNLVILKSENPHYSDLIYIGDDINKIRIIGKAVKAIIDIK